jgi:hypothetical protein
MEEPSMSDTAAGRIMEAWKDLEQGLRAALPVCSVAPPTQPSELLSALRINHSIGEEEERRIRNLREIRNRVAHGGREAEEGEADAFESEVRDLLAGMGGKTEEAC